MIEFEVKYELACLPEGIDDLKPIGAKIQKDVYYDTKEYSLIRNGNFMRVRNDLKLDFKIDLDDNSHLFCKELSFEIESIQNKRIEINNVLQVLNLPKSPSFSDFHEFIDKNGFQIIAPIKKKRTGYYLDENCNIYIDEVDDLGYFLEAEIMINEENISSSYAEHKKNNLIDTLITSKVLNETSKLVNVGYVELYLLKHNKYVYNLGKFKL